MPSSPDLFVNLQEPGTEEYERVERLFAALRRPSAESMARVRAELVRGALQAFEPKYGEGITQAELEEQRVKNRELAEYVDSIRPDEDGDVPPPTQ